MKNLLWPLVFCCFACNVSKENGPTLAYSFDIEPDTMHVQLRYTPVSPDTITFQYGNLYYGGMTDLMNGLVNLTSSVPFTIDSVKSRMTFSFPEAEPILISYDIIDTHTPAMRVRGEMFRPILTSNYFFSLSHSLFLDPLMSKETKDTVQMSITLEPKPMMPMYFSCAPALKPGKTITISLKDGMDALVTGATDLQIENYNLGGISNYIVLRVNEKNQYNQERFRKYIDAFLPAMNEFWGNLEGEYYSLIAAPFVDIDYHNISGTSFQNGFHVKYSGDTILANEEVVLTISHEIMHRYIGSGAVTMSDEHQWFNEGFTDYTTWYLASQCGVVPAQRLAEKVRETYTQLATSPVRNTPNADIRRHFWEGKDYERLPYQRGALFAAYLDKQISKAGDKSGFRNFMRMLKTRGESQEKLLTPADLVEVASQFLPRTEVAEAVDLYLMKGELIPIEKIN
jgi:predicted metalloprotease with PDZ domain